MREEGREKRLVLFESEGEGPFPRVYRGQGLVRRKRGCSGLPHEATWPNPGQTRDWVAGCGGGWSSGPSREKLAWLTGWGTPPPSAQEIQLDAVWPLHSLMRTWFLDWVYPWVQKKVPLHEKHHPALPLHGPTAGQIRESSTELLDVNKFCFIVSVQQTVISGIWLWPSMCTARELKPLIYPWIHTQSLDKYYGAHSHSCP